MRLLAAAFAALTFAGMGVAARSLELVTRDVYLMGTRASLATRAASRADGITTLETALDALEQTERELSTWRDTSDISQLNRQVIGVPWRAAPRLCQMLSTVWDWHRATGGAFDPGIGRLLSAWDIHGGGAIPAPEAQAAAKALSGLGLMTFDPSACTVTRRADATIDVGAFGKGEALDRVEAELGDRPWMVDLGGQISVGGSWPDGWPIAIADPVQRDRTILHGRLFSGSVSTSGGSERDLTVGGTRISHHFDPRTGQPATFSGSVTVWHRYGLAADALSTALFVMGREEGLRWAEAHGIAAMYATAAAGTVRLDVSRAFRSGSGLRITGPE
jgi:thiamine biosynthesis lipoprotein